MESIKLSRQRNLGAMHPLSAKPLISQEK